MATDPEQFGEHSTTEDTQPPEMASIDIATEGDVIFVLQQTRLRVSSAILSSASPVFKAMFGPNFAEGQGQRSAREPREVPLFDDDICAMTRLCRLLHHQSISPDASQKSLAKDAEELFDLAVLADKYAAIQSMKMVGGYLLWDLGSYSTPSDTSMISLLYLAAVACMIEDRRHFALFTRRLLMDHVGSYSTLASHPALAMLPVVFLLLVEEQRKNACLFLRDELLELATSKCPHKLYSGGSCEKPTTDYSISLAVTKSLPTFKLRARISWPPSDRPLRYILKETYDYSESIHCRVTHSCHNMLVNFVVYRDTLRTLCERANKVALGLCLDCLSGTAQETDAEQCPHQLLKRWIENDSFL